MSQSARVFVLSDRIPRTRAAGLLALYTAAVFGSAFLLFLVQPMWGRMVLPLLGGSPAVWITSMLFFQAALLGGYAYAHLSTRLGVRRQAMLHLGLLAVAALLVPLGPGEATPAGDAEPVRWLLGLMVATVGPPFLVLAATGPLLQSWFARSRHPHAADPYRLYAASNLGSLLALLAYPAWVEPRLRLAEQSGGWAVGYAAIALAIAGCAATVWGNARARPAMSPAPHALGEESFAAPTARERAIWVAYAFVPSGLFLAVTTYLTTDLAPVPLLWVIPLALYLLSFTLVFAPRALLPHGWMTAAQPSLLVVVALLLLSGHLRRPAVVVPIHLLALFVTAMVCHGELARRRPDARYLTEFYLWLAVGGVLGGVYNALLAPMLFPHTWEYPVLLVLACLARPWPPGSRSWRTVAWNGFRTAAFIAALLLLTGEQVAAWPPALYLGAAAVLLAVLAPSLGRRPTWLAVCIAVVLLIRIGEEVRERQTLLAKRSFFGSYRVERADILPGYNVLTHGSTLHGAQALPLELRREPLTYYVRNGPLGDIFATLPDRAPRRVAVVGLGTGTTAAYGQPGERWTFYEIDPGIVRVARNPRLFTYLRDSPAETRVVLGDARLRLADAPPGAYDLIVLDAFTSDAVPVHLLTREALELYLSRLAPGGRIAFHISNRYLDLESVLAELTRERGLTARVGTGPVRGRSHYQQHSTWFVVARDAAGLAGLAPREGWRAPRNRAGVAAWTDDFSSVLGVFRR